MSFYSKPHRNQVNQQSVKSLHRQGDWICCYCRNLNFAFRKRCNRCKSLTRQQNQQIPTYLDQCQNDNYHSHQQTHSIQILTQSNQKSPVQRNDGIKNKSQKLDHHIQWSNVSSLVQKSPQFSVNNPNWKIEFPLYEQSLYDIFPYQSELKTSAELSNLDTDQSYECQQKNAFDDQIQEMVIRIII